MEGAGSLHRLDLLSSPLSRACMGETLAGRQAVPSAHYLPDFRAVRPRERLLEEGGTRAFTSRVHLLAQQLAHRADNELFIAAP